MYHNYDPSEHSECYESRHCPSLVHAVGNTPMLAVHFRYKKEKRTIYGKAEHLNMTGSIKDRMALYIINQAYERGTLKKGDIIVEATSGNTGIAFSAIGKAYGHRVKIYMPDWMSQERKDLIRSLGAEIILVSKEQGGFLGSIRMTEELAKKDPQVFLPKQFANEDNIGAHYTTTGPEIWTQFQLNNLVPDAFIAGVGTGGTIMGVGKYLKEQNPRTKIHPLEPANSPTMSTGHKVGAHRIQGISDEFIPEIVKLNQMDSIVDVDDGDSIIMAQKFSSSLGLGVGISTGANFLGALKVQNEMIASGQSGNNPIVVTIFCDDNKKYLSTDLMRHEPSHSFFLSKDVELLGYEVIPKLRNL